MQLMEIKNRISFTKSQLVSTYEMIDSEREIIEQYGNSFAFQMSMNSLVKRRNELIRLINVYEAELAQAQALQSSTSSLRLAFSGPQFENHEADLGLLGQLATYFQRLHTAIVQTLTIGPTERGPIAQNIQDVSRLRLTGTFPSSFGLEIAPSEQGGLFREFDVNDEAVNVLFAALKPENENELLLALGSLGPRAISSYRRFISALDKSGTTVKAKWINEDNVQEWNADAQTIRTLRDRVAHVKLQTTTERQLIGELHTASLSKGTFEFLPDGEASSIRGRFIAEAGAGVRECFGHLCTINVLETAAYDEVTDRQKVSYSLLSARLSDIQ